MSVPNVKGLLSGLMSSVHNAVNSKLPYRRANETDEEYNARMATLVPTYATGAMLPLNRTSWYLHDKITNSPRAPELTNDLISVIDAHAAANPKTLPDFVNIIENDASRPEILKWFSMPEGGMSISALKGADDYVKSLEGSVPNILEQLPEVADKLSPQILDHIQRGGFDNLAESSKDRVRAAVRETLAASDIVVPKNAYDIVAHEYGHVDDLVKSMGRAKQLLGNFVNYPEDLFAKAHATLVSPGYVTIENLTPDKYYPQVSSLFTPPVTSATMGPNSVATYMGKKFLRGLFSAPASAMATSALASSDTLRKVLRMDPTGIGGKISDFAEENPVATAVSGFIPQVANEALATLNGLKFLTAVPALNNPTSVAGNLLRNGSTFATYLAAPAVAGLIAHYRSKANQAEAQNARRTTT